MRERAHIKRQEEMQEKLRKGLVGQRLGKHKVQAGRVDVQLGEDLSESLRALKVNVSNLEIMSRMLTVTYVARREFVP